MTVNPDLLMRDFTKARASEELHVACLLSEFLCLRDTLRDVLDKDDPILKCAYDTHLMLQEHENLLKQQFIQTPRFLKESHELILTSLLTVHAGVEKSAHLKALPHFEAKAQRLVIKQEDYIESFPWVAYEGRRKKFDRDVASKGEMDAGHDLQYKELMSYSSLDNEG